MAIAHAASGTPKDATEAEVAAKTRTSVVFEAERSDDIDKVRTVLIATVTPGQWWWAETSGGLRQPTSSRGASYAMGKAAHLLLRSDITFYRSVADVPNPNLRAAAEWARREWRKGTSESGVRDAPKESGQRSLPTVFAAPFMPSITYLGLGFLERSAPGTLERLHNILDRSVAWAALVWQWVPYGLTVSFHEGTKTFAYASFAGQGPATGKRLISFRADSFKFWKDPVILRTALHELTHHYREERWPRVEAGLSGDRKRAFDHDELFCGAFGELLFTKLDFQSCTFQLEPPDKAAVQAHREKYKARTEALRERRAAAARALPAQDPSKGVLVFTGDPKRIDEAKLTWATWNSRGTPQARASWWFVQGLRELAETVPVGDWHRLSVRGFPGRYSLSFLGLVQHAIDAGYVTGEVENVLVHKMLDAEDA